MPTLQGTFRSIRRKAQVRFFKRRSERTRPERKARAEVRRGLKLRCETFLMVHRRWLASPSDPELVRLVSLTREEIINFALVSRGDGMSETIRQVLRMYRIAGIRRNPGIRSILTTRKKPGA